MLIVSLFVVLFIMIALSVTKGIFCILWQGRMALADSQGIIINQLINCVEQ